MMIKLTSSYQQITNLCLGEAVRSSEYVDEMRYFLFYLTLRDECEWLNVWDESVDAVRQTKVVCAVETLQPAAPLPRTGSSSCMHTY